MNKLIKTESVERILELIEAGRVIYKKHSSVGCPIYFTTVDDKPRSKMQIKLVGSEVYSSKLNSLAVYVNR